MRPNSASKKFWAEAVATDVSSVVAVMPVTSIPLTPRLKRVWRRINKAKVPPTRAPTIPRRSLLSIAPAPGGNMTYAHRAGTKALKFHYAPIEW